MTISNFKLKGPQDRPAANRRFAKDLSVSPRQEKPAELKANGPSEARRLGSGLPHVVRARSIVYIYATCAVAKQDRDSAPRLRRGERAHSRVPRGVGRECPA